MINRFWFVSFIFTVLGICISSHAASDYNMDIVAVSSAGGEAKSDSFYLVATAGQPVAGCPASSFFSFSVNQNSLSSYG